MQEFAQLISEGRQGFVLAFGHGIDIS
jgi:hypothetical protein